MSNTFISRDDIAAVPEEVRFGLMDMLRERRLDAVGTAILPVEKRVGFGIAFSDGSILGLVLDPAELDAVVAAMLEAKAQAAAGLGGVEGKHFYFEPREDDA